MAKVKVICDDCDKIFETEDSRNFDALYGDKIFLDAICPYCDGCDVAELHEREKLNGLTD